MQGVVDRVNAAFSTRVDDPFPVYYAKGIETQVSRDIYSTPEYLQSGAVVVWLVMNYIQVRGQDVSIFGECTCTLNIISPTDGKFTQAQRDEQIFHPRLLPVYEVLCKEIARERWFQFKGSSAVLHTDIMRPYWGGNAEQNGVNQPNLFKKEVDAISLHALKLRIKLENCQMGEYSVQPADGYPLAPSILVFEDDIEIVVDGGTSNDPLDGDTSISIPSLAGKDFYVTQRNFGQFRKSRDIEVVINPAGGFSLLDGYQFKSGDTYTIKIRPRVAANTDGLTGTLTKGVTQVFVGSNS
jgi:hypothetical protein